MTTATSVFKKVGIVLYLSILVVVLQSPKAEALSIIIEPDAFSPGTNLTHLFRDVTIQSFYNGANRDSLPGFGDVYATTIGQTYEAPTGTMVFGGGSGTGAVNFTEASDAAACWSGGLNSTLCSAPRATFGAMIVQFDRPTPYFSIMAHMFSDPAGIYAYGIDNQLVGACTYWTACSGAAAFSFYPLADGYFGTLSAGSLVLDSSPLIQTVIIGGILGAARLDRMTYGVPEPSSLALMLLGFGFLVLAARKTRTT